ncbi:MAG: hypothetical protein HY049_18200 [Acidobacteria bacterium]|nr:hypothetical protein [Acidobacteriota bacterium]
MATENVAHRSIGLRRLATLALALAIAFVAAAGAAPSKAPATKSKAPATDPNAPEKQFAATIASGTRVQVSVFPNLHWPGKIVRFDPFIPKTDANIHSLALNSMWEIYGRQRGSFQQSDATISSRPDLGAIIVYHLRSGSKFCVYPVSSDEKGTTLAALKVWME